MFQGEYPTHGGPFHNPSIGDYGELDMGGFPSRPDYPASNMNLRRFPDEMGPSSHSGGGNGFSMASRRDSSGLLGDGPGRGYKEDFRGNSMGSGLMERPADRPEERPGLMGAHPESGSLPSTLLSYLVSVANWGPRWCSTWYEIPLNSQILFFFFFISCNACIFFRIPFG